MLFICICMINCRDKSCNCLEDWDSNKQYEKGESVFHNDTCWVAINRGNGVEPGPWLVKGNDVWIFCQDSH